MAAVYRTWADGDAFTAEDAGDYFMRQAMIVCDNQTDRDGILTPNEGLHVWREDIDAVEVYDGSAWLTFDTKWQTYTATFTNLTLGTAGTQSFKYMRQGKKCTVRFAIKLGTSGFSVGTEPTFSLPFTAAALVATANILAEGNAGILDTSASAVYPAEVYATSTTTRVIRPSNAGGTYVNVLQVTANVPMVWATIDEAAGEFTYDLA